MIGAPAGTATRGGAGQAALWPGPWAGEDGGPRRQQTVAGPGLGIRPGERLRLTAQRHAPGTTMLVHRDPGELYVLRHTIGRRPLTDPVTAWVERIDPRTLAVLDRSADLPAGPFWPGGMAAHADGSLHVVFGAHAHRLSAGLELLASRRLPAARAYNSFVVLPDGTLVAKDLDRTLRAPSTLVALDPETLAVRAQAPLGEPSIARLSADGDAVYAVGATSVHRLRWDGAALTRDATFRREYLRGASPGGYGWDAVLAGGQLWFLDNGAHDFVTTMRGAGLAPGPVRLHRVALDDAADHEVVEVCGAPRGAVTNPPLYDAQRRVAIAYDSANGVVQAFRFDGALRPLWRRELSHAAHLLLYPATGEVVLHDYRGPAVLRTRAGRALGRRTTGVLRSERLLGAASRAGRDEVVVLDVETGAERARAAVPTAMQSVVFPAPGHARDLYWCTISTLARLEVA